MSKSLCGFSAHCLYHVTSASPHFIILLLIMYYILLAQSKVRQSLKGIMFVSSRHHSLRIEQCWWWLQWNTIVFSPRLTCRHELYYQFKLQYFLSLQLPNLWLVKKEMFQTTLEYPLLGFERQFGSLSYEYLSNTVLYWDSRLGAIATLAPKWTHRKLY